MHGLSGLADGRIGGNRAKLTPSQRQTVRANLQQYMPRQLFGAETATPDGQFWTVTDLQRAVESWFGVTWDSPTSYVTLLRECDFTYQRTQYELRHPADVMAFDELLEKN